MAASVARWRWQPLQAHKHTHTGIAENIQLTHNMVRRIFQAAKKPLKGIFEKLHAKKCLYITKRKNRQACGIESGGGRRVKLAVYGELGNLDKQPKNSSTRKIVTAKVFFTCKFYCILQQCMCKFEHVLNI